MEIGTVSSDVCTDGFSFSLLVVGWGERMTGRNFRRETASGRRKEMLREEVFKKRRMAAHTPVLRNTTVRSIPSAMPVKSVRNRLPEDFSGSSRRVFHAGGSYRGRRRKGFADRYGLRGCPIAAAAGKSGLSAAMYAVPLGRLYR